MSACLVRPIFYRAVSKLLGCKRAKNAKFRQFSAQFSSAQPSSSGGQAESQTRTGRVVSVPLCEEFKRLWLVRDQLEKDPSIAVKVPRDSGGQFSNILHCTQATGDDASSSSRDSIAELFIFRDGVISAWNLPEEELAKYRRILADCETTPYAKFAIAEETDSMEFRVSKQGISQLIDGEICLNLAQFDGQSDAEGAVVERCAFAHALATSAKLGIWEQQLKACAEPLSEISKAMKEGRSNFPQKKIVASYGELFDLRHRINLSGDILDPDEFWDRERLSRLYHTTIRHLSVAPRLRKINEDIAHCIEILELCNHNNANRHSAKLEWLIIALIAVEVLIELWYRLGIKPESKGSE